MNAVIYARYSTGPRQTEQSIEGQIRDCMEYARQNDLSVIDTYIDRAISGTDFENRPEFTRMIKDCERRQFSYIIVWKVDRFGRNREEIALNKVKMKKQGVKLLYAKEHIPDGPEGIILESLMEGMAEYYSAELSQKVKRGLRESALKGHVLGGNRCTGYKIVNKKYEIDQVGAAAVHEIFERYAAGESAVAIAEDLNRRKILTATNKPFTKGDCYRILRNEKYIGTYRYGDIVSYDTIPPIIEPDLWQKIQDIIAKNSRNRSRTRCKAPEEFLLTGKVYCGYCGQTLIGESGTSHTGTTYWYYKCSTKKNRGGVCEKKNIRKEKLEEFIILATMQVVLSDEVISHLAKKVTEIQQGDEVSLHLKSLQKQMKEIKKSLDNLMKAIEMGIITDTTRERMIELEARKQDIAAEIARAEIKKPLLSEKQVRYWLESFRDGNIENKEFKYKLVNTFIGTIHLYNEKAVIIYNFCEDNNRNRSTIDYHFDADSKQKFDCLLSSRGGRNRTHL